MKNAVRQWLVLAVFVIACFAVAGLGSLFTGASDASWYPALRKPSWTPPNWVFGPVWTALYLLIGIAGWLVWRSTGSDYRKQALLIYAAQLGLNLVWSPLFFGLRSPALSAIDITALWLAIGGFALTACHASKVAALLFLPYWAWVTYAAALNYAIWWLNRGAASG